MDIHLFIYNEIVAEDELFLEEGGATPTSIQKQIQENPAAENIIVHISSPGGSVFAGWTIGNILKSSGKNTIAKIEGFCGSIATWVALSCDRVEIAETGGRFMIHNPSIGVQGEKGDLAEGIERLEKIEEDLVNLYAKKTGLSRNKIIQMMNDETEMTPKEAKQLKFVDEFMEPVKAVAHIDNKKKMTDKNGFQKMYDSLMGKMDAIAKIFDPKAITVTLEDGMMLFVDSEDEDFEGKAVWLADEEGNRTEEPAPDGTHMLNDGREITIEGGVVTGVDEAPAEDNEEVENLKKEVEDLKAELAESKTNAEASATVVEEVKKAHNELKEDIVNLKKLGVGDTRPPARKRKEEPANKFDDKEPTGHSLDGWAAAKFKKR